MLEDTTKASITKHASLLVLGGGRDGCDRAILGGKVEEDGLQQAEVDGLGAL